MSAVTSKDCTLKHVKGASSVIQLPCVQSVTNVPLVVKNLPVGARLQNFWQTWLKRGAGPKIVQILREGYTLPFRIRPNLTRSPTVISRYVNPHRNSYLLEALQTKSFPQGGEVQNGDTGNHQDIPPARGVGNLSRLQGCLLPYTNTGTIQEISQISCPGSDLPVQSTALWSVHSIHGVHCLGKGGETDGHTQGYKNPPVPRRLVGQSQIPPNLSPSYPDPDQDVPGSRLAGEPEKSELEPQQVFNFVGYQFDLRSGRVRPTPDRWQSLQGKIQTLLLLPACPVRQFMSLIGLLTATEKQVHLGRLHMRPIQWHLKNNWRVPESLEKVIPLPRSLHPHLQWWLNESNVLQGQPLHPIKHALQIFTDASKEGWGAH